MAPTTFPPPKPIDCPECQANKHGGCNGWTWSNELDEELPCPCFKRGHLMTPTAPPA